MRILLPPSETKRAGGDGPPVELASLTPAVLAPQREAMVAALVSLSADPALARRVLKLSARQEGEIEVNRMLREAPTMPALDRYTGVLFDALDARSLDAAARRWLGRNVWIHSAPFGPVGALDPIPSYRLGAGTALPGFAPLRRHWADAVTTAIAGDRPSFVLDLRSEAYVALGPVPASRASVYIRVVTEDGDGARALNHFNKKAKGGLVRALAQVRPSIRSAGALGEWARLNGTVLRPSSSAGVWELVVPG